MTTPMITVLDVGHGSCVVLSCDSEITLVDTGAGATILEHLKSMNRSSIRRVVISHADRDHVGALHTLLSDAFFNVEEIWLNSDAFKGSRLWADLNYELDALSGSGKPTVKLDTRQGNTFSTGPFKVDIVAPRLRLVGLGAGNRDLEGRRIESNTLSVVARISMGDRSVVVLPGDLDEVALDHFLDQSPVPDLTASILIFPHHGGHVGRGSDVDRNAEFAKRFTKLVMPQTIVFSIGRGQHGTPRKEVVEAVRSAAPGVRILCTQLSMLCSAQLPPGGEAPQHLIKATARGKRGKKCCAGTVAISFYNDDWHIHPSKKSHERFISVNAVSALCKRPLKG
jgi:beta-lactamase superfamily II metal-dependent hydrolase